MIPKISSDNSEELEEVKNFIKSVLVALSKEDITLERLSHEYEDLIGDSIPFKKFNYTSLKEFLISMPDVAHLGFDKTTKRTLVYHIDSVETEHLTAMIAKQKPSRKSNHKCKPRLHSNPIDPNILKTLMTKLSNCSNKGPFKKIDLLSEVQKIVGDYSFYNIHDLDVQLRELHHILVYDEEYITMKNCKLPDPSNHLEELIKQKTRERLSILAEKYSEGIFCPELPDVYRKEFGVDLEYRELGFTDIKEFVSVMPNIFQFVMLPNNPRYKVINSKTPIDHLQKLATNIGPVENDTVEEEEIAQALPTHPSPKLSKMLIPEEFMNWNDSVELIKVENISDDPDVIVSEIENPSLFWIIIRRNKSRLSKMMNNLQKFYLEQDLDNYKIPRIVLKPGLHVACVWYDQWHRGIIKRVGSKSLKIQFYDFGTTKVYKTSEVYYLNKRFSTVPAQAILCGLHNVSPVENYRWCKTAIKKFNDRTIEKEFAASIISRNKENNSVIVDLIDTSSEEDIYINQWMVFKNLAVQGNYFVEKDNFMFRYQQEHIRKQQKKLDRSSQNVNNITLNEEPVSSPNYMKPLDKLKALKKCQLKSNILQCYSTTSSNNVTLEYPDKSIFNTSLDKFSMSSVENVKVDHLEEKHEDSGMANSSFTKPADKLEALRKYKNRFQIGIPAADSSSNLTQEKPNKSICDTSFEQLQKDCPSEKFSSKTTQERPDESICSQPPEKIVTASTSAELSSSVTEEKPDESNSSEPLKKLETGGHQGKPDESIVNLSLDKLSMKSTKKVEVSEVKSDKENRANNTDNFLYSPFSFAINNNNKDSELVRSADNSIPLNRSVKPNGKSDTKDSTAPKVTQKNVKGALKELEKLLMKV